VVRCKKICETILSRKFDFFYVKKIPSWLPDSEWFYVGGKLLLGHDVMHGGLVSTSICET
jgi:hypothetical protein